MNTNEMINILVVDDRPENLLAIESLLASDDLNIVTVESGEEALKQVWTKDFALVLLDVQMPEMDGYETAELMRSNKKTRHIPIIFVSAINKDEHHLFKGYDSGAVDYLFKPIHTKILESKVKVFVSLYRQKKEIEETSKKLAKTVVELRNKDEQLRQKQKLEAIGKLVGGVAHEINNPLSFVLSHLRRVSRNASTLLNELSIQDSSPVGSDIIADVKERLGNMNQSLQVAVDGGYRIANIVQDLSRFARTDTDERPTLVQLNDIMNKVINLARHDIKSRAQLVERLEPVDKVMVSEGRIFQVFLNLLMNAIYAIDEGDPDHNQISIRSWMNGEYVNVEVTDTGCGIPKENISKIFDPFFTTKPVGAGSGLGLATCYGIVQSHGGRIEVSSELNAGSSFTVYLPKISNSKSDGAPLN